MRRSQGLTAPEWTPLAFTVFPGPSPGQQLLQHFPFGNAVNTTGHSFPPPSTYFCLGFSRKQRSYNFQFKGRPGSFYKGPTEVPVKGFLWNLLAGPWTWDLSPQTSSRQGNILHTLSIINNLRCWTWIESICYNFASMVCQKINFLELTVGHVRISSNTRRHDNHRTKCAISLTVV